MKDIVVDPRLVAYCGLYCGACAAYLRGRCPGCLENKKASWCKVRACCVDNHFGSCADCNDFPDPRDCRKFNNWIAKLFGLIFRSDRAACISQIRRIGIEGHTAEMARRGCQTIKKG